MRKFLCKDCKVDTCEDGIEEYYMVLSRVWQIAHKQDENKKGFLCISCLEQRIGRNLTPNDFMECPLNYSLFGKSQIQPEKFRCSQRLRNRLRFSHFDPQHLYEMCPS